MRAVVVAILLAAPVARADEEEVAYERFELAAAATDHAPTARNSGAWYGWQTLLADGAVIGLAAGTRAWPVLGGGLLSGPLVHLAHGNGEKAFLSLGLRVIVPFTLGLIGFGIVAATVPPCHEDPHEWLNLCLRDLQELGGFAIGAGVGYLVAIGVDAAFIAREPDAKPRARESESQPGTALRVRPWFGASGAGVVGAF